MRQTGVNYYVVAGRIIAVVGMSLAIAVGLFVLLGGAWLVGLLLLLASLPFVGLLFWVERG